jgi:hypothetical protein
MSYNATTYFRVLFPKPRLAFVEPAYPPKGNSYITSMWEELRVLFEQFSVDPEVNVVVLSSMGTLELETEDCSIEDPKSFSSCIASIQECIAAVEGFVKRT